MQLTPINDAPPLHNLLNESNSTLYISASPGTDLWRKPPSTDIYNVPAYVAFLPVETFQRARVTVKANWTRQYDQGGLVLFLPEWPTHSLWVKSGIEFVDGKPNMSTVGARDAADWSMLPLPEGATSVTFEIEREEIHEKNGTGASLWVYLIEGEERKPIRELTWGFKEKADLASKISVGIYAARPTKLGDNDKECLNVAFDDLSITF